MTQIASLDGNGSIPLYVARPAGTPKAAVIVIQEIFGTNEGIRMKCANWAQMGYLAVAPDLFWRIRPGIELNPDNEAEFKEAIGYLNQYSPDEGVQDIEATIKAIRAGFEDVKPITKVGCVGFCLGGRLAYMTAARTDIDASVAYYGVAIDQMLNEANAIARPLMLHIPMDDSFVGPEQQKAIHAALDSNHHVTIYDYPGLGHGFADAMGKRRDPAEAPLADQRTEEFLAKALA